MRGGIEALGDKGMSCSYLICQAVLVFRTKLYPSQMVHELSRRMIKAYYKVGIIECTSVHIYSYM